jgi:hypothetical protein
MKIRVQRWSWVCPLILGATVSCVGKVEDTARPAASGAGAGSGGSSAGGSSGRSAGGASGSGTGGTSGSGTGGSAGTSTAPVDCSTGTHGAVSPARRLTQDEYANAVTDVLGLEPSKKYPGSSGVSVTGYSTEPVLTTVGEQSVAAIMSAAEEVALALEPRLGEVLPCVDDGDDACANTFLDTVGRLAFRRSLTDEERETLLAIYSSERSDDATFSEAVAVMTAAMLQMPAFLYVVEADVAAGQDRARTGPELATRLALHLWGSVPDEELLVAAEGGELETKEAVKIQAERLLEDPRADRAISRFFREWSETSTTAVESKDRSAFDYLDDAMVGSINESFDRFVADQVRSGGTLTTLLTTNSTFVDENLAEFFGLDPVDDWTSVMLPADRYAGLATQPAVLAAHAHTVSASYVFRGRFVMKRLLCIDLGSPPANAMTAFGTIEKPPNPTGKETALSVQARPDCGGCHRIIDPAGLAFEHFDGMGHYVEAYESGKAIDPSGALIGVADDMIQFENPADMMAQIAALPEAEQCFAANVFRYTASKPESGDDSCSVQMIAAALGGSEGNLSRALIEATQTDGFLYRRGE